MSVAIGMGARLRARLSGGHEAFAVTLRSRDLRRAQAAFGLTWTGEWAATVALGVLAFRDGGAAAVGLVALLRMVPAAVVAPFAATVADQVRREQVLTTVAGVRAATLALAAAVVLLGGPIAVVYGALVAATVAYTLYRPAHSALLPSIASTPAELTSANVVRGLLDSLAVLGGPALATVLLALSGPGLVFAAAAALSLGAAALTARLRYETPPQLALGSAQAGRAVLDGLAGLFADRRLAVLTAMACAQTFTRGCVTVLTVVIAIDLVEIGESGVGVLTAAIGAGAVGGSLVASALVGSGRLSAWSGIGVALWGLPLVGIALLPFTGPAIVLLAVVGVGNALVDVGVFTVLARLADDRVLARTFAAFEAMLTIAVGIGAFVAPFVIDAAGIQGALVVLGLVAPVTVAAGWATLGRIDADLRVQERRIDLLRSVPMLRPLPEATIEQLAASLGRQSVPAGSTVFEQGDPGDRFYVVETGRAEVTRDGLPLRALGAGAGFGEIALLRDCARTATVRATEDLALRWIDRRHFLLAVTGYTPSAARAEETIRELELADAVRQA